MTSSGRKISSLSVTYDEEYLGNTWSKRPGDQHCCTLDYQNTTASVPGELTVGELCDHLQSDHELYEDSLCTGSQRSKQVCQPCYHGNDLKSHREDSLYPIPPVTLTTSLTKSQECGHTATAMDPSQVHRDYPRNDSALFALEDRLRHRVNVSIEEFRADLQEMFYEYFVVYRHSTSYVPVSDSRARQPSEDVEISSGSVCTSDSSSVTVDSGVCMPSVMDREEHSINLCLIKLQTYAAAISSSLQRTEYAVNCTV